MKERDGLRATHMFFYEEERQTVLLCSFTPWEIRPLFPPLIELYAQEGKKAEAKREEGYKKEGSSKDSFIISGLTAKRLLPHQRG